MRGWISPLHQMPSRTILCVQQNHPDMDGPNLTLESSALNVSFDYIEDSTCGTRAHVDLIYSFELRKVNSLSF